MTTLADLLEKVSPSSLSTVEDLPWPEPREEFTLHVAVIEEDNSFIRVLVEPPIKVETCLYERGASPYHMTDELFGDDLPDSVGLWRCHVKYFFTRHTDWESGIREDDYGFEILAKTRL